MYGINTNHRHNLGILSPTTLIYGAANTVQILDTTTQTTQTLPGSNTGGVGAIAVHPSRKWFAVGEKGDRPAIRVYSYPDLVLTHVLEGGTEAAYACLAFSQASESGNDDAVGTKLASVGGAPDYMLTVWDWEAEAIILRLKAFAQDVYAVGFSPDSDGKLITCGTGHIKFWEMATTFTGLKLKGTIGKFGKIELSDVSAFVKLPNDKVVSGTESGHLLVWDGNVIQFQVFRTNDATPCHNGMVEFLQLRGDILVSAGMDGVIRHWALTDITNAPVSDSRVLVLDPLLEHTLPNPKSAIRSLSYDPDSRISYILDASGALLALPPSSSPSSTYADTPTTLLTFHSGPIPAVAPSPSAPIAATGGADAILGAVSLLQTASTNPSDPPSLLFQTPVSGPITTLLWAPQSVDPSGLTLLVGTASGHVEAHKLCSNGFLKLSVSKPHTGPVTALSFSPDGAFLASASGDATVFFYTVSKPSGFTPLGLVSVPSPLLWLDWAPSPSQHHHQQQQQHSFVLASGQDGHLVAVPSPAVLPESASFPEYILPLPSRTIRISRSALKNALATLRQDREAAAAAAAAEAAAAARAAALAANPDVDPALLFPEDNQEEEVEEDPLSVRINDRGEVILPTMEEWLAAKHAAEAEEELLQRAGEDHGSDSDLSSDDHSLLTPAAAAATAAATAAADISQDGTAAAHNLSETLESSMILTNNEDNGSPTKPRQPSIKLQAALFQDATTLLASFSGDVSGFLYTLHLPSSALNFGDVDALQSEFLAQVQGAVPDPLEELLAGAKDIPVPPPAVLPPASVEILSLVDFHPEALISTLAFSPSRHYLLSGGFDGSVRITPFANHELGSPALFPAHNQGPGPVLGVACSHDESQIVSVAADGTIIVLSSQYATPSPPSITLASLPSIEAAPVVDTPAAAPDSRPTSADSIISSESTELDTDEYSVYQAKLKREQAKAEAAAEVKKARVRDQVAKMKVLYDAVLEENHSAPQDERLPLRSFQLDMSLQSRLEDERSNKLELAAKMLEWESHRKRLLLAKLRARFIDPIETHRIVVSGIKANIGVATFRTTVPSSDLLLAVEDARAFASKRDAAAAAIALANTGSPLTSTRSDEFDGSDSATTTASSSSPVPPPPSNRAAHPSPSPRKRHGILGGGLRSKPAKSKLELRREKNEARETALGELMSRKPRPDYVDPDSQAAIDHAAATIGDYKLKSSPDYVVPEHQRVNATSKSHEMVLLAWEILERKRAFNRDLLAVRSSKASLIERIRTHNARLAAINAILGLYSPTFVPEPLAEEEYPWAVLDAVDDPAVIDAQMRVSRISKEAAHVGRLRITGSASQLGMDLEQESQAYDSVLDLFTYQHPDEARDARPDPAPDSVVYTLPDLPVVPASLLHLSSQAGKTLRETRAWSPVTPVTGPLVASGPILPSRIDAQPVYALGLRQGILPSAPSPHSTKSPSSPSVRGSELETHLLRAVLEVERSSLIEQDTKDMKALDTLLSKLRVKRFEVERYVKMAEMRMIVLYQELQLLKEFDKRDQELNTILSSKLKEQAKIQAKIEACASALAEKEAELAALPSEDDWTARFEALLESAPASIHDALWKIFSRNVSKRKRSAAAGAGADKGSQDSDSDSDAYSDYSYDLDGSSDGGDSDDDEEDVIPPRCEPVLFDAVLDLREERLSAKDTMGVIMEERDRIASSSKALAKTKELDLGLTEARAAIDEFQREKQIQLNMIDVTVTLKLDQIYYIIDSTMPDDLSEALIFVQDTLTELQGRSSVLMGELRELEDRKRSLDKLLAKLVKDKKAAREKRDLLLARAEDVQMLKFGRIIDLDHVLEMSVNKSADELKALLRAADAKRAAELAKAHEALRKAKDELATATAANTQRLNSLTGLMSEQQSLERSLNVTQGSLQVAEFSTVHLERERKEAAALRARIKAQDQEIAAIKTEIRALSLKGNPNPKTAAQWFGVSSSTRPPRSSSSHHLPQL